MAGAHTLKAQPASLFCKYIVLGSFNFFATMSESNSAKHWQ